MQVMLFSQGISTAEELAGRIVLLFQLCEEQLSSQSHYDFGLRALKSVLVGAGGLKRKALQEAAASGTGIGRLAREGEQAAGVGQGGDAALLGPVERDVLIRSDLPPLDGCCQVIGVFNSAALPPRPSQMSAV